MSRRNKLLQRFLKRPKDFTYCELETLLEGFGYKAMKTGKAAGSRAAFINQPTGHIIRLHRPHPGEILKRYQMEDIEQALRAKGIIQ